MSTNVPAPSVMTIDREDWATQLHLSNFVNTYYQYRDLQQLPVRKVLIVGPGQGLDTHVLRWRKYDVVTFDIDDTFNPDVIGSVHDLAAFSDREFDAVIVSHVLEHLAEPYFDQCLKELARVSTYALVYLPVAGRHFQFRLKADLKGLDLSWIGDVYNFFHKPDGITPKYCSKQHYWEVGMRGYRTRDLKSRFARHFNVLKAYRNKDWLPSYNFILGPKS